MTDKNGGSLLQGEDTARGRGSIRERGERVLYGGHVETGILQIRNPVDPTGCVRVQAMNQNDVARLCQRSAIHDFWAQRRHGRCADSVLNDLRVSIGTLFAKFKLLRDSRAPSNRRSAIDHVPELFLDGSKNIGRA